MRVAEAGPSRACHWARSSGSARTYRYFVLPKLEGDETEKEDRIGVARLRLQDLPIDLLGCLQASPLIVLDCHCQCIGARGHGGNVVGRAEFGKRLKNGRVGGADVLGRERRGGLGKLA